MCSVAEGRGGDLIRGERDLSGHRSWRAKSYNPSAVSLHSSNGTRPGRRYVGDITYLPIADGSNLYLATCIDLGSRKLAGWQVADHMRAGLVEDALRAAARDRGSLAGAVFHSDHGSVGGFNRSSQHLDHGGVQRWRRRIGAGRPAMRIRPSKGRKLPRNHGGKRVPRTTHHLEGLRIAGPFVVPPPVDLSPRAGRGRPHPHEATSERADQGVGDSRRPRRRPTS